MAQPGVAVALSQLPEALRAGTQALLPGRDRRRQVSDDLYRAILSGDYSFWDHIHPMFLDRDITRHDIRELVRRALSVTRGNYRGLLELFRIPPQDYKRFMNFLTTHDCRADFREFRNPTAELTTGHRVGRVLLPPLVHDVAEKDSEKAAS